jgi:hypothetical protein
MRRDYAQADLSMLRIILYLMLGASPLWAQASFDEAGKVAPAKPPAVIPPPPPGNAVMTPGVNAPPPGTPPKPPELPVELPKRPVITVLTISPGTVREGLTDVHVIRTTIKLSVPALKDLLCHVVSEDPKQMVCANIVVPKGQQQADGVVEINWKKVLHNGQVEIRAYDDEHLETVLHTRVYLRKKLE